MLQTVESLKSRCPDLDIPVEIMEFLLDAPVAVALQVLSELEEVPGQSGIKEEIRNPVGFIAGHSPKLSTTVNPNRHWSASTRIAPCCVCSSSISCSCHEVAP